MSDEPREAPKPMELPRGAQRSDLRTLGDVKRELGWVYDAAKTRAISTQEMNGLTQCLFTISKVMSEDAVEKVMKRLEEIEARIH